MLKLMVSPSIEPVSIEEMKEIARISDDSFDNILPSLIKAGREAAENFQNRVYLTQTWEESFDTFPDMPLIVSKQPLQKLESVICIAEDGTEIELDVNDFVVSIRSNKIWFKKGKRWPKITLQDYDSVIFRYKAGIEDPALVDEVVKTAIKVFIIENLDNPENPNPPEAFYNLLWYGRRVPV